VSRVRGISRSSNLVVDAGKSSMTFGGRTCCGWVRCGHSRAPFQIRAVSVGLENIYGTGYSLTKCSVLSVCHAFCSFQELVFDAQINS